MQQIYCKYPFQSMQYLDKYLVQLNKVSNYQVHKIVFNYPCDIRIICDNLAPEHVHVITDNKLIQAQKKFCSPQYH